MRDVVNAVAPGVLILTETNVPHDENVSYFGDGDEAHLVYQFSLPPLLLDAFVHHDAGPLNRWLSQLDAPRQGTSYFNFTASHDGIGVRPLEGLVSNERLQNLVRHVSDRGGQVSTRVNSDGSHTPYELNISYVDAIAEVDSADAEQHAQRFLASQAVMLALQGIPGIYFHSLVGSQNDLEGLRKSGQPRRINRHKYDLDDLQARLAQPSLQQRIFSGYQNLLRKRIEQPAFHPDAEQHVVATGVDTLLVFTRTSVDADQIILVATNVGSSSVELDVTAAGIGTECIDLISGGIHHGPTISVPSGCTLWLTPKS